VRAAGSVLNNPLKAYGHAPARPPGARPLHGANLGVSADAYRGVGGFRALALHEDVQLVASLAEAGWRIARTARARVASSAREVNRVAGGFAGYLAALAA
jgi:cellulose synthase/poly-beta-1,6-N-acetylglucosamine synthase-like glycosyltransferase